MDAERGCRRMPSPHGTRRDCMSVLTKPAQRSIEACQSRDHGSHASIHHSLRYDLMLATWIVRQSGLLNGRRVAITNLNHVHISLLKKSVAPSISIWMRMNSRQ